MAKGEISEYLDSVKYQYVNENKGLVYKGIVFLLSYFPYQFKKKLFLSSEDVKIARCIILAWRAKRIKSDVVVAHVYPTLLKVLFYFGVKKNKIIFYFHTSDFIKLPPKVVRFLDDYCLGMVTIANEPDIKKVFHKPFKFILNGVDISLGRNANNEVYKINECDFNIIYAGQMIEGKGILQVIAAIKPLIERDEKIKLWLVGNVPTNANAMHLTYFKEILDNVIGYEKNIHLVGWISHSSLISLYEKFDLGVLLSQEREGNSLFLMECIACGVPVIASKVGGIPLVVDDNVTGLLVDNPNDIEEIRNKIFLFRNDADLYTRVKSDCLNFGKRKFSFKRVCDELDEFLETINQEEVRIY